MNDDAREGREHTQHTWIEMNTENYSESFSFHIQQQTFHSSSNIISFHIYTTICCESSWVCSKAHLAQVLHMQHINSSIQYSTHLQSTAHDLSILKRETACKLSITVKTTSRLKFRTLVTLARKKDFIAMVCTALDILKLVRLICYGLTTSWSHTSPWVVWYIVTAKRI